VIPTAVVTFGGVDAGCIVTQATIRHGRDDPGAQPDASTMTCELRGILPAGVDVGSVVTLTAELDGELFPRFAGRVTDLATGWGRNVDDPVAQLVAAGPLASMGRRVVGDAPWPVELDGDRVNRIIGLAGVPADPLRTDVGTLQLLGRDVDAQPALELAQRAALDAGGMLWQATDGTVLYADAEHRRAAQPALELDSCTIPLGVRWQTTLEGLVNDVRIRYGAVPAGGEQAEIRDTRPESVATFGTYAASLSTQLVDATAAAERADVILARQAEPAWLLSGVELRLELLTEVLDPADDLATTLTLLGLDVHALLSITGMPAGSPYTSALLFVEGWHETIRWGHWQLALVVSDYCRTAPAPRWDDVDPGWTWDAAGGSVVRVNLVPNPRIGVDLTSWLEYGAINSRQAGQTGWALGTSTSIRATMDDAAVVPTYATGHYTDALPIPAAGVPFSAVAQVRSNRNQRVALSVDFYDNGTDWTWLGSSWDTELVPAVVLEPNVAAALVSRPMLAPPGAGVVSLGCYPAPNNSGDGGPSIVPWQAGDWLELTNAQLEQTDLELTVDGDPVTGVFHGGMPDTFADDYAWAGAPDASPSTRTTPPEMTWDTATCLPPITPAGRWDDVPATTRWDQVDAGTSWDQWED
jgi:hypothetical protein